MRSIATALAALVVTGCVTSQVATTPTNASGRIKYLELAGADGPVLVAAGNPPAGSSAEAAVLIAASATASGAARGTRFTADPAQAAKPRYRVISLFDPPPGLAADAACAAYRQPVPVARRADRTGLYMAFCRDDVAIAAATVRGARLEGPRDPELDAMVKAGMREMFPGTGDPNAPASLGSISVSPPVGFRLNPLEGIID